MKTEYDDLRDKLTNIIDIGNRQYSYNTQWDRGDNYSDYQADMTRRMMEKLTYDMERRNDQLKQQYEHMLEKYYYDNSMTSKINKLIELINELDVDNEEKVLLPEEMEIISTLLKMAISRIEANIIGVDKIIVHNRDTEIDKLIN